MSGAAATSESFFPPARWLHILCNAAAQTHATSPADADVGVTTDRSDPLKTPRRIRILIVLSLLLLASAVSLGTAIAPALAEGSAVIELAQSRPQGGGERPPRAAMQACSGKSAADACEFTLDDEQVTGTCRSPDAKRPLACVSGHADHSQG